jgi:biotin carboxyl carrier protein
VKYFVTIDGREIAVQVDGGTVRVAGRQVQAYLSPIPGTPLQHLMLGHDSLTLSMERQGPGDWQLGLAGARFEVRVVDERTRHIEGLTGATAARTGPHVLRAPMPGLVVRVLADAGQLVSPGQGLLVLEAMKMENELRATALGQVTRVSVTPGQAVEKGQVLMEFGPAAHP